LRTLDIASKGYIEINDFITPSQLDELKDFTFRNIEKFQGKNFRLYEDSFKNTVIEDKNFQNKLELLINEIVNFNFNKFVEKEPGIYKVLRVVAGKKQKKQANLYHFDAHLITILIPILIPQNKNLKNGDLVIFPNIRKVNQSLLLNIFQKLFFQNFIIRKLLSFTILRKILNYKILKLIPGKIYVFNGFTTLHGNMEIDEESQRATLLIHAYDVFNKSSLVNKNRKKSIEAEIKNIRNN